MFMKLFSIDDTKLKTIKKDNFKIEKDLQVLTEENLKLIFGLEFVRTEFPLDNLRIDTLAFDNESNSFVIIEYKRGSSDSVIDQGYAYLSLLLNNKADFILEYNEKLGKSLRKGKVDWSQSKIIFIAENFSKYQLKSIEFNDLPFELWEVNKYDNQTISYNKIKVPENKVSISTINNNSSKISTEIKKYTEYYHLSKASAEIKQLYEDIRDEVQTEFELEIIPRKTYISFKNNGVNIFDIEFKKNNLKMFINLKKGELKDPEKIARDVSTIGHHSVGDYDLDVNPVDSNIYYIMNLIRQSYDKNVL